MDSYAALRKISSRGELAIKLYNILLNQGKKIEVDIKEPVDYEKLREALNKHLRRDQEISQQEIIILHRYEDELLLFIFVIAIGLTVHKMKDREVEMLMLQVPSIITDPSSYAYIKEKYPEHTPTVDISYYDQVYHFKSGITTILPRKLICFDP